MKQRTLLGRYRSLLIPDEMPRRRNVGRAGLLVMIAVVLLLLDRYGIQPAFYREFSDLPIYRDLAPEQLAFAAQLHFSISCTLLFVAVPLLYHLLFPEDGCHRYGLSLRSAISHFPIYATLLAFMLPVLWLVSADPGFHRFYPMYKPAGVGDWLLYEAIYMFQFFAVEFFFRGFCLFRLERFTGMYAIAIMIVPYALIHIHKPLPEAFGSIAGGLILGYLAIRTRSIWPGLFVHCGVAFSMDWFSLLRMGWFSA